MWRDIPEKILYYFEQKGWVIRPPDQLHKYATVSIKKGSVPYTKEVMVSVLIGDKIHTGRIEVSDQMPLHDHNYQYGMAKQLASIVTEETRRAVTEEIMKECAKTIKKDGSLNSAPVTMDKLLAQ